MNQNENHSKDYIYIIYNLLNQCNNNNLDVVDKFKKKILHYYLKQNVKYNTLQKLNKNQQNILNNSYNLFIDTNVLEDDISNHFKIILQNIKKQIISNFMIDTFQNDGRIFLLDKKNKEKLGYIDLFSKKNLNKKINVSFDVDNL